MKGNKFEHVMELLSRREFMDKVDSCIADKIDTQFLGNLKESVLYFGKTIPIEKSDFIKTKEDYRKDPSKFYKMPGEEEMEYSRIYARKRVDTLIYSFDLEKMHKDGLVFFVDFNFDNSSRDAIDAVDRMISKAAGVSRKASPLVSTSLGAGNHILLDKFNKLYHPNFIFVRLYTGRHTSSIHISAVDQSIKEIGSETAFKLALIKGMELSVSDNQ